jgi:hypothetical protein
MDYYSVAVGIITAVVVINGYHYLPSSLSDKFGILRDSYNVLRFGSDRMANLEAEINELKRREPPQPRHKYLTLRDARNSLVLKSSAVYDNGIGGLYEDPGRSTGANLAFIKETAKEQESLFNEAVTPIPA